MSQSLHSIRLRPPWEDRGVCTSATSAVRYRIARRFGRPTGLESGERVWLVMERSDLGRAPCRAGTGQVGLNGQRLGEFPRDTTQGRWEITALLLERNELTFEYDGTGEAPGPRTSPPNWIGEVRLEIEAARASGPTDVQA